MKAKIDSAKASRTFGDPPMQVYEVVAGGIVYDCMDKRCLEIIGQEIEFEMKSASDSKYHPRMRFPKANQSGHGKFVKGFQVPFEQTAEGQKLKAKTMVLSYAKDIIIHFLKPDFPFNECIANVKLAYDAMIPLLWLDQIQDLKQQPVSDDRNRNLATLLAEMKPIISLDALSNWWKTIPFKTLSAEDGKTLVAEKDKKKAELTVIKDGETGRHPNF